MSKRKVQENGYGVKSTEKVCKNLLQMEPPVQESLFYSASGSFAV
jgi:adenosylmethionine-8-amino-7-oxononanoate aminotransferase